MNRFKREFFPAICTDQQRSLSSLVHPAPPCPLLSSRVRPEAFSTGLLSSVYEVFCDTGSNNNFSLFYHDSAANQSITDARDVVLIDDDQIGALAGLDETALRRYPRH